MNSQSLAVGIASFDRPQYFGLMLDSLVKNEEKANTDFFLFQDGAVNKFSGRKWGEPQNIEKCLELWRNADLPNKHTIQRELNVGIGINKFKSGEYLFNERNYEQVLFLEDDWLLSKYYLGLVRVLLKECYANDRVGIVSCIGRPGFSFEEKKSELSSLETGAFLLAAWATTKTKWNRIRIDLLKYYDFIKNIDYKQRPTPKILEFFRQGGMRISSSSFDGGLFYAELKAGMFPLNTVINRVKPIGREGVHFNPEAFERLKLSEFKLDEFEDDKTRQAFAPFNPEELYTEIRGKFNVG